MRAKPIYFATYLAPNMLPVYHSIVEYVGARLGRPTTLSIGTSFAEFERGDVDVGFLCGLPYVELTRQADPPVEALAAPVLQGERYGHKPIYFSDVIARRDHLARSFAELRGCRWAYNDRDSHSGYNITRYTLVRMGETRGFFGEVIEAGFHQKAIQWVSEGRVDAAAIDSQTLAIELRERPTLRERLRVIDTLGPASIQPVVAATRLPPELRADLRAALVAISDEASGTTARKWLDYGFIERFIPVTDAHYDDIRAMLAAAAAANFLALR